MSRVLIIDDEKIIAQMLKDNLELQGHEVEIAYSGTEGIEKACSMVPDVITLDIQMPDMTGFEVLKKLKEDKRTKDIAVLILSVKNDKEDLDKGYMLGAREYIAKPFSLKSLGNIIKDCVSESETAVSGL
ncbi:MAG: response regulator [Elusimicrobia bacterium]|nr:response regulator [Elusimicrobiota bacterium]